MLSPANRAVEVNEMWRVRQKELELDERVRGTSSDKSSVDRSQRDDNSSRSVMQYEMDKQVNDTSKDKNNGDRSHKDGKSLRRTGRHAVVDRCTSVSASCLSKREYDHTPEGLKDEELEKFLHSRFYFSLMLSGVLCAYMLSYNPSL